MIGQLEHATYFNNISDEILLLTNGGGLGMYLLARAC